MRKRARLLIISGVVLSAALLVSRDDARAVTSPRAEPPGQSTVEKALPTGPVAPIAPTVFTSKVYNPATVAVVATTPRLVKSGAHCKSKGPFPRTVRAAKAERAKGTCWTKAAIRGFYRRLAGDIGTRNLSWKKQGRSALLRAKKAYGIRHFARMLSRAMMSDPKQLAALRARDKSKYGNPDGPTFKYLVRKARRAGLKGDAIYEAIVASASRTSTAAGKASRRKR